MRPIQFLFGGLVLVLVGAVFLLPSLKPVDANTPRCHLGEKTIWCQDQSGSEPFPTPFNVDSVPCWHDINGGGGGHKKGRAEGHVDDLEGTCASQDPALSPLCTAVADPVCPSGTVEVPKL